MADPTLTAQLAQANAVLATLQLPQGLELAGDAFIQDDQIMVPVADSVKMESRLIAYDLLVGPTRNHFNVPAAFRPAPSAGAALAAPAVEACSANESAAEDPELNVCSQDPEINLRQMASTDPTQREEGHRALEYAREQARAQGPEAERRLEQQIQEARERIVAEHPNEAPAVEQTYQQYRSGQYQVIPPSCATGGGSGSSSNGAGGGSGSAAGGGAVAVAGASGTSGGIAPNGDVAFAGFAPGSSDVLLTTAAFVPGSLPGVNGEAGSFPVLHVQSEEDDTSVVPAPFYFAPVTVSLQSHQIPEFIGRASSPGQDAPFFQALFGPAVPLDGGQASRVVGFLTQPSPETRSYIEAARRATADVLRNYWRQERAGSLEDAHRPLALTYRYDTASRGIVISISPGSRPGSGRELGATDRFDEDVNPFDRLRPRFAGVSLASFRIGVDGVRRESDLLTTPTAVVLIPFAQFAGIRLTNDVRVAPTVHPDGAATDRATTKVAHRGNSGEHRGGEGRGDARDGRSRGHGGRHQNPQDGDEESLLASANDEDAASVTAA